LGTENFLFLVAPLSENGKLSCGYSSKPKKVAFILKNSKEGIFNPLNTFTTYFLIKVKLYFNDNEEVNFIYVALSGLLFEKLTF